LFGPKHESIFVDFSDDRVHWQPTMMYFRLSPLALAVWNKIKSILLAKEDELGD